MAKMNVFYAQSGGVTAVINATACGVIETARKHRDKIGKVYAGRDGRYYCKRQDGTTGLIVGGIAGGVLGNIIAPGGSKTLGTLLGAAGGAAVGSSIDKDNVRCR